MLYSSKLVLQFVDEADSSTKLIRESSTKLKHDSRFRNKARFVDQARFLNEAKGQFQLRNLTLGSGSYMHPNCAPPRPPVINMPVFPLDVDLIQFALSLEYTECEWFLYGSVGCGLDAIEPELALGGPPHIGAQKANFDDLTRHLIYEFGLQKVGYMGAIRTSMGGFPRPLIDLSRRNFARLFDEVFGYSLEPPFDPYCSTTSYLLASYVIPYMGMVGYVGANPNVNGFVAKREISGLAFEVVNSHI